MQRFLSELQRRKVLRVASAYVVGGWIILQVALALQTAMNLPASFSTVILSLLIIGLPVALVGSWFLEITPEGIKRTVTSGDGALVKPQTPDIILAAMLALVVVVALVQAVMPRASAPAAGTADAVASAKAETPALGNKSIAVLPFANVSKNEDDAVFADGLTEAVLDVLARVRGLRVISRTSSFAFKGKDAPLPDIAKRLGVRHVLEGSVRRDGDAIRVTVQLIDVTTDTHLWSQTFERTVADIFGAQDEIAHAVGLALNLEINAGSTVHGAPTKNLDAYRLYLRARGDYFDLTRASLRESVDLFDKAIALDPTFADAHAQLAWVLTTSKSLDPVLWRSSRSRIVELTERAHALDPNLGTAYVALANLAGQKRDWDSAWAYRNKAFELDPTDSLVVLARAVGLTLRGNIEDGTRAIEALSEVDPLFSGGDFTLMNFAFARGDDAALTASATRLRATRGFRALVGTFYLAVLARERDDRVEAQKLVRTIAPIMRSKPVFDAMVATLKSPTNREAAIKAIDEEAGRNPNFDPLPWLLLIGASDHLLETATAQIARDDDRSDGQMFWIWHLVARGEGANPKLRQFLRNYGIVDHWRKHGWPDRCRAQGEDDFECS